MGQFDGKVAVVTGGALGIGGAACRRLAAEGASVVIADIADDAAEANRQRIAEAGGTAMTVHADVGVTADVQGMIERGVDEFGRLDILVQNAFGVGTEYPGMKGSAVDVEEPAWDRGMSVLMKALYLGAKYAVPEMAKSGDWRKHHQHCVRSLVPDDQGEPDLRGREVRRSRNDPSDGS